MKNILSHVRFRPYNLIRVFILPAR